MAGVFSTLPIVRSALQAHNAAIRTPGRNTANAGNDGCTDPEDAIDRLNASGIVTASLTVDRAGLSLASAINDERDADLAEAAMAYQQEQTRSQAAPQTTAMMQSLSLLDFLK